MNVRQPFAILRLLTGENRRPARMVGRTKYMDANTTSSCHFHDFAWCVPKTVCRPSEASGIRGAQGHAGAPVSLIAALGD